MLAQVRTPTCKGLLQLKATFINVKKHVSPPGLEPGSLKYHSSTLTTKQRRHDEEPASHQSPKQRIFY